jgi:hypothetical protein
VAGDKDGGGGRAEADLGFVEWGKLCSLITVGCGLWCPWVKSIIILA